MDYFDTFGEEHFAFLSKRQSVNRVDVKTATVEENQRRGVASGVRRKEKAVIARIKRGQPTNRVEREQDKRAAKYILMMFGCILQADQKSFENVLRDEKYVGMMVRVSRNIWLTKLYARDEPKQAVNMADVYESSLNAAIEYIRACGEPLLENYELGDFTEAHMIVEMILQSKRKELNESFFTEEDWLRVANGLGDPCYLSGKRVVHDWSFKLRTNLIYKQMEPLDMLVSDIKTSLRYSVTTKYGWKKRNQVVAMCSRELEKHTLSGFQRAQSILERFSAGKMCTGKRGKSKKVQEQTISNQEALILHGVARAKPSTLVRFIDQGMYAIRMHREFPTGYVHNRG
jgi:hypothetical protein